MSGEIVDTPRRTQTQMFLRWGAVGLGLAVFLIVIGLFYFSQFVEGREAIIDRTDASHVSVVLTDNGFEPRYMRIKKGTTVEFSTTRKEPFWPASDVHPTHEIYPTFDPKEPVAPDASWSFTFDRVGKWRMHDHLRSYFTGIIYVDE